MQISIFCPCFLDNFKLAWVPRCAKSAANCPLRSSNGRQGFVDQKLRTFDLWGMVMKQCLVMVIDWKYGDIFWEKMLDLRWFVKITKQLQLEYFWKKSMFHSIWCVYDCNSMFIECQTKIYWSLDFHVFSKAESWRSFLSSEAPCPGGCQTSQWWNLCWSQGIARETTAMLGWWVRWPWHLGGLVAFLGCVALMLHSKFFFWTCVFLIKRWVFSERFPRWRTTNNSNNNNNNNNNASSWPPTAGEAGKGFRVVLFCKGCWWPCLFVHRRGKKPPAGASKFHSDAEIPVVEYS